MTKDALARGSSKGIGLTHRAGMWASPDGSAFNDGQSPEAWAKRHEKERAKKYNGNGGGTPLAAQASMWQTPSRADGVGGHTSRGGDRKGEALLGGQVKLWPTPSATDGKGSSRPGQRRGQLSEIETLWPTPKTPTGGAEARPSRAPRGSGGEDLEARSRSIPRDPPTPTDGHECSPKCRRLNPLFVEWLMGFPLGWTDCERSGTESFRTWLLARSSSSPNGSGW